MSLKKEILEISESELQVRIQMNAERLCDPYYQIGEVYQAPDAKWPGDKEGRALLAFVCHAKMTGKENPCMREMIRLYPQKVNERYYLGTVTKDIRVEQQLSGHSWLLRGLCAYYEYTHEPAVLDYLRKIVEGLYLPTAGHYASYPLDRSRNAKECGWVSGVSVETIDGWCLSTDIGCAFMSIDGLTHYYQVTGDERVRPLIDEMIEAYIAIDKYKLRAQTHCTLTAARGMLRMYGVTGEARYLQFAEQIWKLYVTCGMTATYQNYNWFGRADSWTEPCAIVDSLMLAGELAKITGNSSYRTLAARIYHNGFSSIQRDNGGAGTDSIVDSSYPYLHMSRIYEAYFCCTMRLAEGLLYVQQNRELLYAETYGRIEKDSQGRYMDGDILYAEIQPRPKDCQTVEVDGHCLTALLPYYRLTKREILSIRQRVLFT